MKFHRSIRAPFHFLANVAARWIDHDLPGIVQRRHGKPWRQFLFRLILTADVLAQTLLVAAVLSVAVPLGVLAMAVGFLIVQIFDLWRPT